MSELLDEKTIAVEKYATELYNIDPFYVTSFSYGWDACLKSKEFVRLKEVEREALLVIKSIELLYKTDGGLLWRSKV